MRGEQPSVGDMFRGFDRFWPALFAWVIYLIAISVLGGPSFKFSIGNLDFSSSLFGLVSFVLSPLVYAVYFFVYPLVLEKQRDTAAALDEAARTVFPRNVVMFWVCGLMFEILAAAGIFGCGIGVFITAPLVLCAQAVAYKDIFGLAGPRSATPPWPSPWMDRGPEQ
jgi:hypothetical protein